MCTLGGNFDLKIPRMRDSFGQPTGKPLYGAASSAQKPGIASSAL